MNEIKLNRSPQFQLAANNLALTISRGGFSIRDTGLACASVYAAEKLFPGDESRAVVHYAMVLVVWFNQQADDGLLSTEDLEAAVIIAQRHWLDAFARVLRAVQIRREAAADRLMGGMGDFIAAAEKLAEAEIATAGIEDGPGQ